MITGFVFVMMLLIEYLNVITKGVWQSRLARNRWGQYLMAAALGAVPGCLGAFAVVTMYSHRLLSLGAVVAAMIATSGDEAFVMFAMFPGRALMLTAVLFAIGIVSGSITDALAGRFKLIESLHCDEMEVHAEYMDSYFPRGHIVKQWRECTAARGILAVVLVAMIIAIATGQLAHHDLGRIGHVGAGEMHVSEHTGGGHAAQEAPAGPGGEPIEASHAHDGESGHGGHDHGGWGWVRITLLAASLVALFIVCTVHDHFLEEHLWKHIARKHIPRVFLWVLGALIVIYVLTERLDVDFYRVAREGRWIVLAVACIVGLIPQSGPHMVFITLYATGAVPFAVLLASSVVQDGHGMLPLLAHSRRIFIVIKIINLVVGMIIGSALMLGGYG
jgi:hypothetical protein